MAKERYQCIKTLWILLFVFGFTIRWISAEEYSEDGINIRNTSLGEETGGDDQGLFKNFFFSSLSFSFLAI